MLANIDQLIYYTYYLILHNEEGFRLGNQKADIRGYT
jgi:hypothetical protein